MRHLLILSFAICLSGCAIDRYERMTMNGFPATYANGYCHGRGDLLPLPFNTDQPLYKQGFSDGERDKSAGMAGDPQSSFSPR